MLPPISQAGPALPDVATILNQMGNEATQGRIQQAARVGRGGPIAPPGGGGGNPAALGQGMEGLGQGLKSVGDMLKEKEEVAGLADFVNAAIGGGAAPEQAAPEQAAPPAPQAAGTLPPLADVLAPKVAQASPAMRSAGPDPRVKALEGNFQKASATLPPVDQVVSGGGSTMQDDVQTAAPNPLGFNEQQVATLRGMVGSGNPGQVRQAAELVMGRMFAKPDKWDPKSPTGKAAYDLARADPRFRPFLQMAMEREATGGPPKAPQTRKVLRGGVEVTEEFDPQRGAWVEVAQAPRWQPDKPGARDERVEMLMATGLDETTAREIASGRRQVTRHPTNGSAQIIDLATGDIIGGPAAAAAAEVVAPAEPQSSGVPSADEGADYPAATGVSGMWKGWVNTITDALTGRASDPGAQKASQALENLQTQTMLLMADAFPGRPSETVRKELQKMAVKPGSMFEGDARSLEKLNQTKRYVDTAIRAQQSIVDNASQHTPKQVAEARQKIVFFNDLSSTYDTVITGFNEKLQSSGGDVPSVTDPDSYNNIPPGSQYRDPQGNIRTKSARP